MTTYSNNVTKQQGLRQNALKQQQTIDKQDSGIISAMLNTFTSMNTSKAREIIMNPEVLTGLLESNNKHNIKCFYVLHAVVISLVSEECSNLLNQMSDNSINTLKRLISVAQTRSCPKPEQIETVLQQRYKKTNLSESDKLVNAAMIQSLLISQNVVNWWDSAISELQRWSLAIEQFERQPLDLSQNQFEQTKTPVESDEHIEFDDDNVWSCMQLAKKLGCPDIRNFRNQHRRILRKYKTSVSEINGWFFTQTEKGNIKRKMFKSEYFQKYKQMYDGLEPIAPTATKQQSVNTIEKKKTVDLTDLKTCAVFLDKLTEMYETENKKLQTAEKNCATATREANSSNDSVKRGQLLKQAMAANDVVSRSQEIVNVLHNNISTLDNLIKIKRESEELLRDTNNKIAKLIRESGINIR